MSNSNLHFIVEKNSDFSFGWVLLNKSQHVAMSCRSYTRRETAERAIKKLLADLAAYNARGGRVFGK